MNKNITITSVSDFQSVIDSLKASYSKIKEIIEKEKKNAVRINETEVWSGRAAKVIYEKYALLNSNYDQIDYSIDLYIKFLEKTLEDYMRIIEESSKNIEEMSSKLDVNS